MKDISSKKPFEKTYQLPYLLGVFLGLNAVSDAAVMVDGANCVMVKADLIAGNHDLFSTLLSETGRHRILCTMSTPVNPPKNPEKKTAAMLNILPECRTEIELDLPQKNCACVEISLRNRCANSKPNVPRQRKSCRH